MRPTTTPSTSCVLIIILYHGLVFSICAKLRPNCDCRHRCSFGLSLNQAAETSPPGARSRTWHRNQQVIRQGHDEVRAGNGHRGSLDDRGPHHWRGCRRSNQRGTRAGHSAVQPLGGTISAARLGQHANPSVSVLHGPTWPTRMIGKSAASVLVYRQFSRANATHSAPRCLHKARLSRWRSDHEKARDTWDYRWGRNTDCGAPLASMVAKECGAIARQR